MWVPLKVHSQYSILDSLASVEAIALKAKEFNLPAVALTDHGNLYGAIDFYKECKEQKVKPIIGCELYVAPESRFDKKKEYGVKASFQLTFLAKNKVGYKNLCKLSSLGFLEGFYYTPRVDKELLKLLADGLICISGSISSKVAHLALNSSYEAFLEEVAFEKSLFGEDYYLEVSRHRMTDEEIKADGMHQESWVLQGYNDFIQAEEKLNNLILKASKELGIKIVATNDTHYIDQSDWRPHEILLNVQSGEPSEIWEKDSLGNPKFKVKNPKRKTYPSHAFDFKSAEKMQKLFQDIPEAISNTLEVADKCQLEIDFKTKHYPVYVPEELKGKNFTALERAEAAKQFLRKLCREGIPKRYSKEKLEKIKELYPGKDPLQVVEERLSYELDIIIPKEMSDYLLIVWDFIHWAKTNGIPMGPGRGSGAGSIVLYLIGITDIEPLRFHLFFERFINPERISYPDIDVDICMDRRGEVIDYVLKKYGKENVAQIITFGSMKAKMTIKDVGRTLSVPLSKVNEIAKLVPEDLNITLEKALEKDPDLKRMQETDEEASQILSLGLMLEGSIRSTGIHAAGIIISGEPLTEHIPICNAKDSEMPVTQYSMKPVELVGMLKVDFLGLKTLTAIQMCVSNIKKALGKEIDWVNLPLDDKPTFDLLNQGKTLGVFQLESQGMQDLARQLHLDKFEEIIAVGALYRPGPMDMIPSFIDRKHGREAIENDHPWMQEILAETYGIMVYQEQVMQIASKLAGFSLGEGDVLRRAMGKKDQEQMAKQRVKFAEGALKNGIDHETSTKIFDKMEKFASYGFNKSHAAAYGFLSYVTAYLKANFPKEWMAALMSCDSHDITKVSKFIREAHAMGIKILPPDINEAGVTFLASSQGIRFSLSGIKSVGEGVVEEILREREKKGPFESLSAFLKRIDTKKVGKKTIEAIIEAGGFDFTKHSRDSLKLGLESLYEEASLQQKEASKGYISLFSLLGESQDSVEKMPKVLHPRSHGELLLKEKELLGFFLTGHPMDDYKEILKRLSCISLSKAFDLPHDAVFRAAFIIESVAVRISNKSGKKFAILMIGDGYDTIELPIWADLYEEKAHLLRENQLIYAVLQVDKREENVKLSCKWLDDLTKASDEMIDACDKVFDKAKFQAERMSIVRQGSDSFKKSAPPKEVKVTKEKELKEEKLKLLIDLREIKLSHFVKMKEIFEKHSGKSPLIIQCVEGDKEVALLQVDEKWGVKISDELKRDLKKEIAAKVTIL